MIINKIGNNHIIYKSQNVTNKKSSDNNLYLSGLLIIPLGCTLGWKYGKNNYEKELESLKKQYQQELQKSMELIPEQTEIINKKNKIFKSITELEKELEKTRKTIKTYENLPEKKLWEKLQTNCTDLISRINTKQPVEMPNCLMFCGDKLESGRHLYEWICKKTNSSFCIFKEKDVDMLITNLENNKNCNKWRIIFVENLALNINPQTASKEVLALMKDIMSNCAEDYNTTLIFQTKDISSLDSIALQAHRVKSKFDINNINLTEFETFDKNMTKYKNLKAQQKQLLKDMEIFDNKLNKINIQFNKVDNLKAKINNLQNNKSLKKYIISGSLIGTVITACIVLINKHIKKRGVKNVNTN